MSTAQLLEESEAKCASLEWEVQRMQDEHQAWISTLQKQHETALERQRIELAGSAEEQARIEEEKAREQRVEALATKAMRRMTQAGMVMGWERWHDQWAEVARQKRMLAAAGARLARPQLTA